MTSELNLLDEAKRVMALLAVGVAFSAIALFFKGTVAGLIIGAIFLSIAHLFQANLLIVLLRQKIRNRRWLAILILLVSSLITAILVFLLDVFGLTLSFAVFLIVWGYITSSARKLAKEPTHL